MKVSVQLVSNLVRGPEDCHSELCHAAKVEAAEPRQERITSQYLPKNGPMFFCVTHKQQISLQKEDILEMKQRIDDN